MSRQIQEFAHLADTTHGEGGERAKKGERKRRLRAAGGILKKDS